jgi:2-keto-3-deoxy-6-phosphogluconate aldolase
MNTAHERMSVLKIIPVVMIEDAEDAVALILG